MQKVTTRSGATYLIDYEHRRACRLESNSAPQMRFDGDWFEFSAIVSIDQYGNPTDERIGNPMHFRIRNHPTWEWRLSTRVVSIEDVDPTETDEEVA